MVKARERAAAQKRCLDRARKAEDRGELREAKNKRRVSQRKAMRVLENREREKASRNIQVSSQLLNTIVYPLGGSGTPALQSPRHDEREQFAEYYEQVHFHSWRCIETS